MLLICAVKDKKIENDIDRPKLNWCLALAFMYQKSRHLLKDVLAIEKVRLNSSCNRQINTTCQHIKVAHYIKTYTMSQNGNLII